MNTTAKNPTMTELFGEVISTYTRAQAIEDGYQVNVDTLVPTLRKEAGIKFETFFTSSLYSIIEKAVNNDKYCNDYEGVIWDIFTMFKYYQRAHKGGQTMYMKVIITGAGRKRNFVIRVDVGPVDIDNADPALTFGLPEDF